MYNLSNLKIEYSTIFLKKSRENMIIIVQKGRYEILIFYFVKGSIYDKVILKNISKIAKTVKGGELKCIERIAVP